MSRESQFHSWQGLKISLFPKTFRLGYSTYHSPQSSCMIKHQYGFISSHPLCHQCNVLGATFTKKSGAVLWPTQPSIQLILPMELQWCVMLTTHYHITQEV